MNKELRENINCIKQSGEDRYRIILDFATIKIIPYLISTEFKYVMVFNHTLSNSRTWEKRKVTVLDGSPQKEILTQNVQLNMIFETEEFLALLPKWKNGIQLIQMNKLPPDYFDPNSIQGNQRFKILKDKCDYLLDLDIPSATDYGTLISPNREYLESLIKSSEINWNDLP